MFILRVRVSWSPLLLDFDYVSSSLCSCVYLRSFDPFARKSAFPMLNMIKSTFIEYWSILWKIIVPRYLALYIILCYLNFILICYCAAWMFSTIVSLLLFFFFQISRQSSPYVNPTYYVIINKDVAKGTKQHARLKASHQIYYFHIITKILQAHRTIWVATVSDNICIILLYELIYGMLFTQ